MDYTDLSFEYQIGEMLGAWVDQRFDDAALFLTIENVLNKPPPVFNDPQYATGPNQMAYPVSPTDNAVGRFVTLAFECSCDHLDQSWPPRFLRGAAVDSSGRALEQSPVILRLFSTTCGSASH